MENTTWNQRNDDNLRNSNSEQSFPIADVVSLQTMVNILIRKGICTPEELYEEEQRRRRDLESPERLSLVQTNREAHSPGNGAPHKHKSNWLKRKMSKKRWTRKLGTKLFGWEWKKVKVKHGAPQSENL